MPVVPLAIPTIVMVVLLVAPGALLAIALGLRGTTALAAAIPSSVALISTAALATGFLPITWGLLPVANVTAAGVLIALAFRLLLNRVPGGKDSWRGQWTGTDEWLGYLGIALAAGLIAFAFLRAFHDADSFSVGYDNFFHMSVIRSYLDLGQASPFVPYDFADPTGSSYVYPTAWHQIAALLMTTGVTDSIPVAQNALTLAVAGVAWPVAVFFWLRSMFKPGPVLLIGSGILAAGYMAFPYLPASYGPLYPFMLGTAMLPFGVGLTLQALRLGEGERLHWLLLAVLGVIYIGASGMAHPNALLGWIAITVALLVALVIRQTWRAGHGTVTWASVGRTLAIAVVLITVAYIVWINMRPGPHWWEPSRTTPQAFGEFWLAGPLGRPAATAMFVVVLIGLIVITRRLNYLYLLAPVAILQLFWLAVASFRDLEFRHFLTGGFYNDLARLGAFIPMALLPLAMLALRVADEWFASTPLLQSERWPLARKVALLTIGTVLLTYATQADRNVREEVWRIADAYKVFPSSRELTTSELRMIRDLPEFVSPDDVVVADTLTGASFMYPLEGLRPIQYHPKEALTPAEDVLLLHLSDPNERAEVCEAVQETSADFVLDFGTNQINMDLAHHPAPGLRDLAESDMVTLVHRVGNTRLYEITGCGRAG